MSDRDTTEQGDQTPLARFRASMVIDYEKWHDGIGYDLDALRQASAQERAAIESLLLSRGARDWRDVEALAALDTVKAKQALRAATHSPDHEIRAAVMRYAPDLVDEQARTVSLVNALQSADLASGLSQTLDQVEQFHPPPVIDALLRGALHREGEAAVHFAAMLMYLHGQAQEPFDWQQRPFFLRFHTTDEAERRAVFRELCKKIGVDAAPYLH